MNKKLIGLVGPKTCGKDTVSMYLTTRFSLVRTAFADPVREIASLLYDIPVELFSDPDAKERTHPNLPEGQTLRDLLKFLGTTSLRSYDQDVWLNIQKRKIERNPHIHYVVTDVRFWNEYEMLKEKGAHIFYIYRPKAEVAMLNAPSSETENHEFYKHVKSSHPVFSNTDHCSTPAWEQQLRSTFL